MTDGTVTQKPKYHCIASEHGGPMRADELRVFYGQLWCSDCWYTHSKAGKHWDDLDRFADVPAAEQQPDAWARMKGGKVAEAFPDRKLAEFLSGFAAGKLEPLYLRPQPAPDVAELLEALTPQVLDWMRCGLAVNGRLQDADHPALAKLIAAIAACRQQGGES